MTSAVVNKVGTDVVTLQMIQTSSDETTVSLREALLDGSKDYHFTVSELSVPLDSCPMHPITSEFALFSIVRRKIGVGVDVIPAAYTASVNTQEQFEQNLATGLTQAEITNIANVILQLGLGAYNEDAYVAAIRTELQRLVSVAQVNTQVPLTPTRIDTYYLHPKNPMFSPSQMVQSLQDWAHTFNIEQTFLGIQHANYGGDPQDNLPPVAVADIVLYKAGTIVQHTVNGVAYPIPHEFLKFSLTCDGSILLTGSRQFWNSFVIRMTNYGASLLGLNKTQLQSVGQHIVNAAQISTNYIAFTQDGAPVNNVVVPFFDGANLNAFVAGQNTRSLTVAVSVPIYQSSEQRLKVSVGSHLPISSNTRIDDGKETVDRDICEAWFENKIRVDVDYSSEGTFSGTKIRSDIYSGQRNFIKKSDNHTQWMKLLTSYALTYYRFYLKITYREFSEEKNSWSLSTKKLPVPENAFWALTLKFVSDI